MNDLKAEFAKLSTNGYLGDPQGEDAYAYLRASSERQVEEGSTFPRQLESIHNASQRDKLRIPLELIFFDDGFTGFEYKDRPALSELMNEIHSKPRALHLVIEDIDRLSRNADWHQGYLLAMIFKQQLKVHYFTQPDSKLERMIRGYIAEEGMKKDIERMRQGNVLKAKSGRVTARRPRYGYIKTDPKDSYYELHPEESKIMRWVYEKLIYEGWTLYKIAKEMNERAIPTRFKTSFWTASTLYRMVTSTVYKGEFHANKYLQVKTGELNEKGKPKRTSRLRPEDDWIKIKVPEIVTPEEWELAREALSRNAKRSSRNANKREWLLTGFLKCAICKEFTFVAILGNTKKNPRRYHGCSSRQSEKARILKTACYSPYVHADELEMRVWEEIEKVIYDPNLIIQRLEQRLVGERRKKYQDQLNDIDRKLTDLSKSKAKFEAAYLRDIYSLDEFEQKMKDLGLEVESYERSRAKVKAEIAKTYSLEDQNKVVLAALAKIKREIEQARQEERKPEEIPFNLKRRILALLVDFIWVDSVERSFTIEGVIKGTYALDEVERIMIDLPQSISEKAEFAFTSSRIWR